MANPKISASQQRKIETMLRKWHGKLTWDMLVTAIEVELGLKTTRQTLCTYSGIAAEYKNKKAQLRGANVEVYSEVKSSDIKVLEQVKALKAEIEILEKKNHEQLRLIERIFMNARAIPNLDLKLLVRQRPDEK